MVNYQNIQDTLVNLWHTHLKITSSSPQLVLDYMKSREQSAQIGDTDSGLTKRTTELENQLRDRMWSLHRQKSKDLKYLDPSYHKRIVEEHQLIEDTLFGKPTEEIYEALETMGREATALKHS